MLNTKGLLAFLLALMLANLLGARADDLSEAATRLRASKVKSWFEQCMKLSDNRQDRCKEFLEVMFNRETQYLGVIKSFVSRDDLNRNQLSKEYQSCEAQSDYEKYVICLGWLSDRLSDAAAGNYLLNR
ncbi:MAG: hypothetical protein ACLPSW_26960 [Roseiarcus sp.]